jgi:predicted dehydrogenase
MEVHRKLPFRVGIAGAGFIADFHLRALRQVPEVSVVAVCDNDEQKARGLQRRWNIPAMYTRLSDMLSGGVDTVHVLVPPTAHAACTQQCLESGCDVFLEKPATVDSAQSRQLLEAAAKAGRQVGVNHNFIFHPAFRRAVKAIQRWHLGGIEHVTAIVNVPLRQLNAGQHDHWMFQQTGNIVLEQMPHPLSQIQCLLGPVRRVSSSASGRSVLRTGKTFYSTWMASMQCERGTAECRLSVGRDFHESLLHIVGQDGSALVDIRRNTMRLTGKTRFLEPLDDFLAGAGGGFSIARQGFRNFADYALAFVRLKPSRDPFFLGMYGSIASFYRALAAGAPPQSSLDVGASIVATCETIAQNASFLETASHAPEL